MRVLLPDALFLVAYAPLGIVLLTLRIFIFLHAQFVSYVLSQFYFLKRLVLRIMSTVLGFVVSVDTNQRNIHDDFLPIISNHVTLFDHMVLSVVEDCFSPNEHVFRWKSNLSDVKQYSTSDLVRNCVENCNQSVHLLPEKSPTGLSDRILEFDQKMFTSLDTVQPVALRVHRPYPIKLVSHPVNWVAELLWQFFTPFTYYYIRYLTPVSRMPDENDEEFSARVRSVIASALGVRLSPRNSDELTDSTPTRSRRSSASSENCSPTASPHSSSLSAHCSSGSLSDTNIPTCSNELRRRRVSPDSVAVAPQLSSDLFPFSHLVPRITDVLGKGIPLERIQKALTVTQGDVESSLDILLDDSQNEEPLSDGGNNKSSNCHQCSVNVQSVSRLNMASIEFKSSSSARQKDLNDRRAALLSQARELFLAKQAATK